MPATHRFVDANSLAGRVIRERKRLGWSQQELAKQAAVNQGTLSLIEQGETLNPSGRVLVNLAVALGITARYLMEGPHEGGTDDLQTMRDLWDAMSAELRSAWIAVGRAMLRERPANGDSPRPRSPKPTKPSRPH